MTRTGARRTPPGRAGRLRLRHSLDVAERGADLLEQKLRILRSEHQRLLHAEEAAARAWRDLLSEAESWLLRGLLLSGEHALDSAAEGIGSAEITIHWTVSMGVRHPAAVSTSVPARPPTAAAPTNTALVHAEAAYGRAVRAAAEYAAAHAAAELVGAEVISTRHRVRALRRHWIPRLREDLARADLALEQAEHEDSVRRRWAAR
ncbi:V-type ATPase, D subunit [Streptomyces ipomoeae]|jgi:vacuolar-type H+-ATPase subunit D/Vma8|uniref:V-type ATPase, D subunit n=3 Tax=Streptomyces ipomoeae TaxID=103232 RepID=A0AAE8W747_9ACTN|nr:V-type ATP synthase subunit D [Streptomyces ipomoeae]EKX65017.1 putative V-type ATPase, D subunit [Streptomyces ipomoeae 91-03]MDX2692093.1 V-type ATP synthase subunit D [Streptomyces ipomoeae]MDX2820420.1 V-type ATP synthase subunit D [Streptomyces ipomoeae]MDX2837468.1 V-type ATP synthase subunit D [Streptomyces ipomoeae]TQE21302.1 V-type ATPase, D subunit [Streptomyces ipomoeae]